MNESCQQFIDADTAKDRVSFVTFYQYLKLREHLMQFQEKNKIG